MAICNGSAELSLRLRLLSIPQETQARTISTLPQLNCGPVAAASGQESTTAPARIAIAPKKMRRSTFSRNTTQAIAIVARPSVLSKRAPVEAGVSVRPRHEQGRAENAAEEHDCAKPGEV